MDYAFYLVLINSQGSSNGLRDFWKVHRINNALHRCDMDETMNESCYRQYSISAKKAALIPVMI